MGVPSSYLEDASGYRGSADALFTPATAEEVSALLRDAGAKDIPVTISGAGTGVTGGRVPHGGWILSVEKFRRLEIHSGHCLAGAAIRLKELQEAASPTGQFYPPDPTEHTASVGGSVATNASGSRSFLYGATRRHVRALQVALMDGSVRWYRRGEAIDFDVPALPRPRTTKHATGFPLEPGMDWVDLFIGSEGILGVVLEAELGLLPKPAGLLAGVVFLPEELLAFDAIDRWRLMPGLRMIEFMDACSLHLLRPQYPEIPGAARAALLIEQETGADPTSAADAWLDRLEEVGALTEGSWFGFTDSDRERFRRFRHRLPELVNDCVRRNGFSKLGTDFAVPIESNRRMFEIYREAVRGEFPDSSVIFGHAGDAHLHVNILPERDDDVRRGREIILVLARRAVELGGTVSAEHGLGKRKTELLSVEKNANEVRAMTEVKRRLDPKWLLGRGSLLGSSPT